MDNELTPTEELILEVLVARYRLGENMWTFSRNTAVTKALWKLEAKRLVNVIHPIVENTWRASLTKVAQEEHLDTEYVPPILRGN